jgi:hypothetical protein
MYPKHPWTEKGLTKLLASSFHTIEEISDYFPLKSLKFVITDDMKKLAMKKRFGEAKYLQDPVKALRLTKGKPCGHADV